MFRSIFTPFFATLAMIPAGFASTPAFAAEPPRVSGPYVHKGLAVHFVHGASESGPVPLTLKEALDGGTAKVHETGSVGELEIENTGDTDLLVHMGDIVKGGKQDRVLASTLIVPPKSGRVPISSYCVEQGRWAARGKEDVSVFASAEKLMPSRKAKVAMRAAAAPRPVATGSIAEADIQRPISQRGQIRDGGGLSAGFNAQDEVWDSVGRMQMSLSENVGAAVAAPESASSLQLALENEKLDGIKKAYTEALLAKGEEAADIVGVTFAINGKVSSAETYNSNALFKKLWPRLLEAAATEAISVEAEAANAAAPPVQAVSDVLQPSPNGTPDERTLNAATRVRHRETSTAYDVETMSPAGKLFHRSIVVK